MVLTYLLYELDGSQRPNNMLANKLPKSPAVCKHEEFVFVLTLIKLCK